MNNCDYDNSRKTLIAEGWTPTDSITELTTAIQEYDASQSVPTIINVLDTNKTPPTYTVPINSLMLSKPFVMLMVYLNIKKLILVYQLLLHSHLCLPLCLVI